MGDVCNLLDCTQSNAPYSSALKEYYQSVENPDLTPSARILQEMRDNKEPFFPYSMRYAQQHADYFKSIKINEQQFRLFADTAQQSLADQKRMEANDMLNFEVFLEQYFAETLESDTRHMHI